MAKTISLAKQVEILFKHGRDQGFPVTYRAVAKATGETTNNLFRIRHGQNINPGFRTVSAIVNYFGTDLGYFSCKTKAGCLDYLNGKRATPQSSKAAILRRIRRNGSK